MNEVALPRISEATSEEVLARGEAKATEWLQEVFAERSRRAALSPEQALAERLNFAFSREAGEVWYGESQRPAPWGQPEHLRWLKKARLLLERIPDPAEAFAFARSIR